MTVRIKNVTTIKDDSGQDRIVCKGKLLFIPNDPTEVHKCSHIPVIISETEKLGDRDRCLCLDEVNGNTYPGQPYINPFTKWCATNNGGKGNDCNGCRKILVFPDEFSSDQLGSFCFEHKFEHGDSVWVECEEREPEDHEVVAVANSVDELMDDKNRIRYYQIKITDNHTALFSVKGKWDIIDEKMKVGLAAMESGEWKPKERIPKTEREETLSITKNEFTKVLESAFKSGENWGVTYSTWFIPTEEDTNARIREDINLILQHVSVFPDGLETDALNQDSAELRSLKQSILESPLKNHFPKKDMSFHDKVIFAIANATVGSLQSEIPDSSWEEIGSKYLESAFNVHNKTMKMQFLTWLKKNYNPPTTKK